MRANVNLHEIVFLFLRVAQGVLFIVQAHVLKLFVEMARLVRVKVF